MSGEVPTPPWPPGYRGAPPRWAARWAVESGAQATWSSFSNRGWPWRVAVTRAPSRRTCSSPRRHTCRRRAKRWTTARTSRCACGRARW